MSTYESRCARDASMANTNNVFRNGKKAANFTTSKTNEKSAGARVEKEGNVNAAATLIRSRESEKTMIKPFYDRKMPSANWKWIEDVPRAKSIHFLWRGDGQNAARQWKPTRSLSAATFSARPSIAPRMRLPRHIHIFYHYFDSN